MKKSELKELIREVIEEISGSKTYLVNIGFTDIYDRFGGGDVDIEVSAKNNHDAEIKALEEFWKNHDSERINIVDVNVETKKSIEEISLNEPATNPSYKDVKVGDRYLSKDIMRFRDSTWVYVSTVLEVEPISKRFGKDDRIVSVKVEAYELATGETKPVDDKKKIWVSQLLQGLV